MLGTKVVRAINDELEASTKHSTLNDKPSDGLSKNNSYAYKTVSQKTSQTEIVQPAKNRDI